MMTRNRTVRVTLHGLAFLILSALGVLHIISWTVGYGLA
jgi:hypothetical protein